MWKDALGISLDSAGSGLTVVLAEEYGGASEFLSGEEYDLLSVFVTGGKGDFLERESKALVWEDPKTEMRTEGVVKTKFGKRDGDAEEKEEREEGEIREGVEEGGSGPKEKDDSEGDGRPLEKAVLTVSPNWMNRLRKRKEKTTV